MPTLTGFYWTPSAETLDRELHLLAETQANSVFIPHHALELVPLADLRRRGLQIYVDWSCFVGERWWEEYPDSVPIGVDGKPLLRQEWYVPVCPNHPQVRARHLADMASLLDDVGDSIDALWLDFIRYPVRWEGADPKLPRACFCRHCLNLFLHREQMHYSEEETRALAQDILAERGEEWVEWKCGRVAHFVEAVRAQIESRNLPLQLGIFSLPWRRHDHDGAIRSVAGQDLALLAESVDMISPMVYHKLCARPISWIAEVVQDVHAWTQRPALPIIQSMDRPEPMSATELGDAMRAALGADSAGVMIFTLEPLLESTAKVEVVGTAFNEM